jgi:ArsR family transcriptional regulator, arsenate/arsenite/antimonite-responsive transcriptional repressor
MMLRAELPVQRNKTLNVRSGVTGVTLFSPRNDLMTQSQLPGRRPWELALRWILSRRSNRRHNHSYTYAPPSNIRLSEYLTTMDRCRYICQGEYMNLSRRSMAKADQLNQLEELFKALADATRLRILRLLMAGELCVCNIHDALRIPQAKASRHLAYLRRVGLVTTRREGLWVYYSLSKSADPVVASIEGATTHVLGHVEALRKDAERLEKQTGCCVPAAARERDLPCCAPLASKDRP